MSDFKIWVIYLFITGVLALVAFTISEKSTGILKAIKGVSTVLFVLAGITFVGVTLVFALDHFAPNLGSGGGSDYEENCVPDPFGGC